MTTLDSQAAIDALTKAGVPFDCNICQNGRMQMDDGGFVNLEISDEAGHVVLDGPGRFIPSLALVCQACGAVRLHSALRLGLLS